MELFSLDDCKRFKQEFTPENLHKLIKFMFTLPTLPFAFDALEPHLDAKTVEIHYSKHHAGYVNKLNELLADFPEFQAMTLTELLANIDQVPSNIKQAVFNNAGQVFNHNIYWETLGQKTELSGTLSYKINATFGSFTNFQEQFSAAGMTQFGSGWVWLSVDMAGNLVIDKTSNADSPLSQGKKPLMVMDVWEHAYYLKYQNLRAKYIESFWNVVNWQEVARKYELTK